MSSRPAERVSGGEGTTRMAIQLYGMEVTLLERPRIALVHAQRELLRAAPDGRDMALRLRRGDAAPAHALAPQAARSPDLHHAHAGDHISPLGLICALSGARAELRARTAANPNRCTSPACPASAITSKPPSVALAPYRAEPPQTDQPSSQRRHGHRRWRRRGPARFAAQTHLAADARCRMFLGERWRITEPRRRPIRDRDARRGLGRVAGVALLDRTGSEVTTRGRGGERARSWFAWHPSAPRAVLRLRRRRAGPGWEARRG